MLVISVDKLDIMIVIIIEWNPKSKMSRKNNNKI